MEVVAFVLTLVLIAAGSLGLGAPSRLLTLLRSLQNAKGMTAIAVLRVVYGLSLYWTGPASASPSAIRGLGIFVIVAGLITPFLGVARFQALTEALYAQGYARVRAVCAAAAAIGFAILSQLPSPF